MPSRVAPFFSPVMQYRSMIKTLKKDFDKEIKKAAQKALKELQQQKEEIFSQIERAKSEMDPLCYSSSEKKVMNKKDTHSLDKALENLDKKLREYTEERLAQKEELLKDIREVKEDIQENKINKIFNDIFSFLALLFAPIIALSHNLPHAFGLQLSSPHDQT